MKTSSWAFLAGLLVSLASCGGQISGDDDTAGQELQVNGGAIPCADPTVFSEQNQGATFYVFCTGMGAFETSDWKSFEQVSGKVKFDWNGAPANVRKTGPYWAPTVIWQAEKLRYVMWASVLDGQDFKDMTRSLGVFTSPQPLGPWKFIRLAQNATHDGQESIDPMIFRNPGGKYYLYWKHYGPTYQSAIMGAELNDDLDHLVAGSEVELFPGYDMGSWEQHVRENPAVWHDPKTNLWHMLYSGGAWRDGTYATGHAVSACGPLCKDGSKGGWHIAPSSDRGVAQVIKDADFKLGGPGGATWADDSGDWVVFAAASKKGDKTRYLHRNRFKWSKNVPFVNNAGHHPTGY